jgi:site-specific DNA-methyltransferase (adenine-specific)
LIELDKIYCEDCLSMLSRLPDSFADSIVTDPPAGISFMGKNWDHDKGGRDKWIEWMMSVAKACLRVLKPGGHALVWSLPRTSHWTATAWEKAGFEVRDRIGYIFGSGFPKSLNVGNGWGTGLKPACEDWWLLRKPLKGTIVQNLAKYGTGAINVDGSRIEYETTPNPATNPLYRQEAGYKNKQARDTNSSSYSLKKEGSELLERNINKLGRWPAHLIHDGSEEVLDVFPVTTSGANPVRRGSAKFRTTYGVFSGQEQCERIRGAESGSGSRFFYCAKASRSEREEGLNALHAKRSDYRENDPDENSIRTRLHGSRARTNHHPTVKPLALMEYLVRLITPKGGVVVDPFAGSGTTCVACLRRGFHFIACDNDPSYVEIAEARIRNQSEQIRLAV